ADLDPVAARLQRRCRDVHLIQRVVAAPTQPRTRGITRGTWRGNNTLYEVDIPASALQSGSNRIEIG
ncbi:polysaccharide lyase family protein, partial [Xanthomonas arboricola]|uniref:polysaccharide lyase family protein n=1 Tax=Xanthomonas arboricola TaxID=56448 RepID=UPI0021581BD1